MLKTTNELVFLSADVITSNKNNNERVFRFLKVANPLTFENYQLNFDEHCKIDVKKGDRVHLELDLSEVYGRTQTVVTSVIAVK